MLPDESLSSFSFFPPPPCLPRLPELRLDSIGCMCCGVVERPEEGAGEIGALGDEADEEGCTEGECPKGDVDPTLPCSAFWVS